MSPFYRFVENVGRRDHAILVQWTERRGPWLSPFMRSITHAGDAAVVIAVCLLMIAAPMPRLRAAGAVAAFTLAVSHALVQLLKRGISRPRPSLPPGACLVAPPDRFSFPSGHAAAALSLGLPLSGLVSVPAGAAVLALALLVGLSRCYLGVHYPGDVLAGWALALVSFLISPLVLG